MCRCDARQHARDTLAIRSRYARFRGRSARPEEDRLSSRGRENENRMAGTTVKVH